MIGGPKDSIAVIVAGGSPLWRIGLSTAIQQDERLQLLAELPELRDGVRRAAQRAADVLVSLTDEPLPALLSRRDRLWLRGRTRLLVLRSGADQADMVAALMSDMFGYGIISTLTPGGLVDGIVALTLDGTWLCPQTRQMLEARSPLGRIAVS
jgi:DNA-binding NarL/FixJ family response regulator